MPGARCVLNASNTAIGCCNFFLARAPDLNLFFDISFLLIALSYAAHLLSKNRASKCALNKAAPDVSVYSSRSLTKTQISSDI
jgi:hypothetical protein